MNADVGDGGTGSEGDFVERAFWDPHSSPESVWAAIASYPVLIAAVYRRSPGLFLSALLPFGAGLALASPPETDRAWATRVVRGERLWLERGLGSEPGTLGLTVVGAAVNLFTLRAAARQRPVRTVAGTVASVALMFLFFDRMTRIYDEHGPTDRDRESPGA